MGITENLGLMVTSPTDNPLFVEWRKKLTGDAADSNMVKIDAAIGEIKNWQDNKDTRAFTWGAMKYGFGHTNV